MKYPPRKKAILLLEDGEVFEGFAVGKEGTIGGEICFNTGMTGYQEIYTDPSYYGQIVITTSSHIGNYGTHIDELESERIKVSGVVINEYSETYSRYQSESSLQDFLDSQETTGISGIDTRKLVRHVRTKGAMNGVISTEVLDVDELKSILNEVPSMEALELSSKVSTTNPYEIGNGNTGVKIAVLDLGVKKSILKNFEKRNCKCKVFPARTSFNEMMGWNPDGFFLSNGPGDPAATDYAIDFTKQVLAADRPLFGICLGNQILAQAAGIKTFKMHHGHRGINHPVKNLKTGLSEITSQNHGFAVEMDSLKNSSVAELTHLDLNDNTVEGLRLIGKPAFAVQYHPESSPGPHDSTYLFDQFIQLINEN